MYDIVLLSESNFNICNQESLLSVNLHLRACS